MAVRAGTAMIATILAFSFWLLPSLWLVNWALGPAEGSTEIFTIPRWAQAGFWDAGRFGVAILVSLVATVISWVASVWLVSQLDTEETLED